MRKSLARLIELLHEMKALVVMEGIETANQRDLSLDSGVDLLQGYLIGKPVCAQGVRS